MTRIVNLAKLCKEFFITTANNLSIKTGFIKRQRKITGSAFVKTLIFGNISGKDCSLGVMCQFLGEDAVDITPQGLDLRFTESAVKFMQAMYEKALRLFKNSLRLDCNILGQFKSIKLLDSSYITLPNSMADSYKGCGASYSGRTSKTKSAIKIQTIYDYLNQSLDNFDITEGIRADQGYRGHLTAISAGELLIADLGYFVPSSFQKIIDGGAYFISRYKSDTNLYDQKTIQKLDLLELLEDRNFFVKDVLLGKESQVKVRIVCHKLTEAESTGRRRKANLYNGLKNLDNSDILLDWGSCETSESKVD